MRIRSVDRSGTTSASIRSRVRQTMNRAPSAIYTGGCRLDDPTQTGPGKGSAVLMNGKGTFIHPVSVLA